MRMLCRLLAASVLTWLPGCNQSVPTSATGPALPAPPATTYVVSGIVAETVDGVARPLPDALVVLQIVQPNTLRTQHSSTDHNGRYTAQVPTGRVYVVAEGPAAVEQPCVATAAIDRDTTIPDVELVPAGRSARPLSTASPIITGFVYETTPQGRKPLQGVAVVLFVPPFIIDYPVAGGDSDDVGRFFLCRVNTPVELVLDLKGYQPWSQLIPGTSDLNLEIELKQRLTTAAVRPSPPSLLPMVTSLLPMGR
jgi:hypothetical protein